MTRRNDPRPESVMSEPVEPVTAAPDLTAPVQPDPFVVEVEPKPMPVPEPELPPPPAAPRRPGIFGPLLGGALAAIGGFALSHFNVLGFAPDATGLATLSTELEQTTQQQATADQQLTAQFSALADRIATLESAPPPAAPDLSRLDALDQRLATLEAVPTDGTASTAALTAKVADLERRLAALPSGAADPALQQKLDAALARLTAAESAATARADEAEAAAQAAARATALDALGAAVGSGQPFAAELQALDDAALTTALSPLAETGAPTLAQLQSAFPDAARQALRLSRDLNAEDGWGDRMVDFLAAQTGARPLTPLEGNTHEAILSRAEFALSEGRVADALSELAPLDPAVKAALDPWMAQARAYRAAATALQAARGE